MQLAEQLTIDPKFEGSNLAAAVQGGNCELELTQGYLSVPQNTLAYFGPLFTTKIRRFITLSGFISMTFKFFETRSVWRIGERVSLRLN
jgi:hypothetical protein